MKWILRLVVLAALIALTAWLWTVLFPSPQKAVHDRLVKLAQIASFAAPEGNIARVANVERFGGFFAQNAEVVVNAPGADIQSFNSRDELMQGCLHARSSLNSLKIDFPDIEITVGPDQQSATANVTMEARPGGQTDPTIVGLKLTFAKQDRNWVITRVETVNALRR